MLFPKRHPQSQSPPSTVTREIGRQYRKYPKEFRSYMPTIYSHYTLYFLKSLSLQDLVILLQLEKLVQH
ncbi:MAG: hypothetical protein LBD40_00975 [Puniceicoccales bacterium]|nr:hypothetical protein [Puniceicoccales bacterium]